VPHVIQLWRYPVKSMAGEPLAEADVYWHGIRGDRRYALVQPELIHSDFPWLTIRERAELVRYRPRLVTPEKPDASRVVVRTPDGEELDVVELADTLGARSIKLNRGAFDSAPLSLISLGTVGELDTRRFRMNLVIDAPDAFAEDAYIGHTLRIGGLRLRVDRPDSRCTIITTDPDTGERDPAILKEYGRTHNACAGVYCSVIEPGRVAVGDEVIVDGRA
jgi:MOSC domain-containing protein